MVCLGAGITCADGVPVETVVDNRNLGKAGHNPFVLAGDWAHLAGHGGWIVLDGDLRTLREDRTGAWSDINATSSPERRTRRWQTLWLDHGTDPADATYAYVLLPGARRRAVARRAADRHWLTVLANDARRQAVTVPGLGLTAATFWEAGTAGAAHRHRGGERPGPPPGPYAGPADQRTAPHGTAAGDRLGPPGGHPGTGRRRRRDPRHRPSLAAPRHSGGGMRHP
ncbi:hypothetical protein SFUMM280S_03426 [Streptomyces fumanus]